MCVCVCLFCRPTCAVSASTMHGLSGPWGAETSNIGCADPRGYLGLHSGRLGKSPRKGPVPSWTQA